MKPIVWIMALSLFGTGIVRADHMMHGDMTMENKDKHVQEKVEKLTKELNLSTDQQEKVRAAINRKFDTIMQAKDIAKQEIRGVLNPEQQKKFDDMKMKKTDGPKTRGEKAPPATTK